MPQYLVAIYHPDNYDPSVENEAMMEEIHALNREMIAAGARKFVGGVSPASSAKSLAVFGCWKPLIWTRHWCGGARRPSPAGRRSRWAV